MVTNNSVNNKPDTNRTQHAIARFGLAGALANLGPLTNGQTIIGNTGNAPSIGVLTSTDGTMTVTNGAGTIDLALVNNFGTSGFLAYKNANSANVTGDGTDVQIAANTEVYDIGGDYNNGTYTFTAPDTGDYFISTSCYVSVLGAAHVDFLLSLVTTTPVGGFLLNIISPGAVRAPADNGYIGCGHSIIDLDAGDTVKCYVKVGGSTKTITINGDTGRATHFCGWRVR